MESVILDVKEKSGIGTLQVRVFSRNKLDDSAKDLIRSMTLYQAREYGKTKGWTVLTAKKGK